MLIYKLTTNSGSDGLSYLGTIVSVAICSGQARTGTLGALSRSFRTCKTGLSLNYSKVPQVISTFHV